MISINEFYICTCHVQNIQILGMADKKDVEMDDNIKNNKVLSH